MKVVDAFTVYTRDDVVIREPCVIAEAGVNHEGSMDIAKRLVEEAQLGGADAIKFQSYKAETIASRFSPAYWDTSLEPTLSQFELFKKHDSFWKHEFEALKTHCDAVGIDFMSTPFDLESAAFLNDMVGVHKISSSDITNRPFIDVIASYGKPIILSVGAAYLHEVNEAVGWIDAHGVPLALLHCVLNYPTPDANAHLGMISDLRARFPQRLIGYSDHTLPADMRSLEVATLLGAVILEKHFSHDKSLPGNDHYHAMDMHDLKRFRENMARDRKLMGRFSLTALDDEAPAREHARRSLVADRAMPEGHVVEVYDLTLKRPAHGISPRRIDDVIGRRTVRDIERDEVLQWAMFD